MIRVYRYGLLAPNTTLVREQMRLAHRYYNTLIEIERGRRAAVRLAESSAGDVPALLAAYEAADAAMNVALQVVLKTRAKTRSRSESQEMRSALAAARAARSAARRQLQEARHKLREDPTIVAARDEIAQRAADLRRSARAYSGLGSQGPHAGAWGTYLLVEAAAEQASKMPLYEGADPSDPHFSRWSGEGRVGVQIQGGLPVEKIFGSDSQIRIDPVDERAWLDKGGGPRAPGASRRQAMRTVLHLRVGSQGPKKAPVWASWPMVMHRPLPPGAILKEAAVALRRIGSHEDEWYAVLTVDLPDDGAVHTCGTGRLAVNVGWRVTPTGTRVLTTINEEGVVEHVELPPDIFAGLDKADQLQATRATNFDVARAALVAWVSARTSSPPWLTAVATTLASWRSPERLAALARRWKRERFDGDEEAYLALETWRFRDDHLWTWESNGRTKTLRRRREFYRAIAHRLATTYGQLVLPAFDKREVAKRPVAETGPVNETARTNRQRAAVSELELCLKSAFLGARGDVLSVDAADATHLCSHCGSLETFDAATDVSHTCACGETWDQDANACRVYMRRAGEQPGGAPTTGGARGGKNGKESDAVEESKWVRARRLAAEKAERMAAAREPSENLAKGRKIG